MFAASVWPGAKNSRSTDRLNSVMTTSAEKHSAEVW